MEVPSVKLISVALFLLLLAGCSGPKHVPKASESVEQFADIPVPEGFILLPTSYSHEAGPVRTASLKYQGKRIPELVDKFFRRVMPQLGWNIYMAESSKGGNERFICCRKGRTVCVVYIRRRMKVTYLEIEIR